MIRRIWRRLRQQDRVEELEELAYSRREIPDRASQGCVVKDSIQITPWRERWAMEVDLHERAKFRVKELERELAEAARETGNGPKVKPITEAEMATMDPPFPPEQIENVRNKIPGKLTTGLVKPVEEAPADPTLREFLVEFRRWFKAGAGPMDSASEVLDDWLDARLGKEESDG